MFTLTPGPAGATPATLAALGQPILHHQDPAFLALYGETAELLHRAFGTACRPVIFPVPAGLIRNFRRGKASQNGIGARSCGGITRIIKSEAV